MELADISVQTKVPDRARVISHHVDLDQTMYTYSGEVRDFDWRGSVQCAGGGGGREGQPVK